jgi:serine/threonine-protein kinase
LKLGDTIGDYRILEELGRGGEGRVFKGEHVITRRKEALKVLNGAALIEPDLAQRFMREIRVQASLNHPNIAAVHNAFWDRSELVMVMELVEGAPLSELLAKDHLGWRQAASIMSQVLAALHHAHSAGVVHRDVSPANIVVGPGGVVKLTDFGLAWAAEDMRVTQSGALLGSVNYMSPEQVRGAEKADSLSDIYSSGTVLYEAATGSRPFYSENAFQVMRAHIELTPTPPMEKNPEIPAELNRIILKAMEKDPARRWNSAHEFHLALEQFLEATPVSSPGVTRVAAIAAPTPAKDKARTLRKIFWQRSSWAASVALGVLAVGATSYGAFQLLHRQGDEPAALPEPIAAREPAGETERAVPQGTFAEAEPAKPSVLKPFVAPLAGRRAPKPMIAATPPPAVTFYPPEAAKPTPIAAVPISTVAAATPAAVEIAPPERITPTIHDLPAVPAAEVAAPEPPAESNNRVVKFFRGLNPFKKKPAAN